MFTKKFNTIIQDVISDETGGIAKIDPRFFWSILGFAALVLMFYGFFPKIGDWNFLIAIIVVILSFVSYITLEHHFEQKAIIQRCQRIIKRHPELAHIWSKKDLTPDDVTEIYKIKDVSSKDIERIIEFWAKIHPENKH